MSFRLFFLLSVLVGGLAVLFTADYFSPQRTIAKKYLDLYSKTSIKFVKKIFYGVTSSQERILTVDELKQYDGGKGSKGLYLAIIGKVFDVSKGSKHYGPGGGYHFFTGRDASRAFVTGNFKPDGLVDDVSNLTPQDILGLEDWLKFYEKDYIYVGKLAGTFYSKDGKPTKAMHNFRKDLRNAHKVKAAEKEEASLFPPCNSEWKQNMGGRVWCSTMSGGISRNWAGVPRLYHTPGKSKARCACVRNQGPPSGAQEGTSNNDRGDLDNPNLKEYKNCPPNSESCPISD